MKSVPRIDDIERITDLERRVAELERIIRDQLPEPLKPWRLPDDDIPWKPDDSFPWFPLDPVKPWPNDNGTTCSKCGMVWKGVMGYCCSDHLCPMGAGPTII